ncbi:MAG: RNA-metabolising metallo-beta-lactamase [Parcubacteria group bacterium Gr01-1014_13]|nr:MAG: RNA-metabolising metallo-beta-lactamase [Parcubacteria group bacterium Gr01-1014_13]
MQITFYGAAGEVTGSCNMFTVGKKKFLVDCGMFQGSQFNEDKNRDPLGFDPAELSGVIVTHAHLDHVGRLPLLVKNGYNGHFYATPPTVELTELILDDALHIMLYNQRKLGTPILYDSTDIAKVMERFKSVGYRKKFSLTPEVSFTFYDAGHIFGSAFVEVEAEGKRIVFSGDIGNINVPILRDTDTLPGDVDLLVCESTYGDRLHETLFRRQEILENLITSAIGRGGTLMIPSFSLERTQELIYDLNDLVDRKHLLPRVPIFLDSPLAIKATKIYLKYPEYYDKEAEVLFKNGDKLFDFPGLVMTETKEESKKINQMPGIKIIIAGAGMMNGGRIVHHAMRYLSDERNTLLIVGYQAQNTLGRQILNGQSPVEIMGERIPVRCHVKAIGALSAHGDQNKLLDWIGGGTSVPKKVLLTHGEPAASEALAKRLVGDLGVQATATSFGMEVDV